ncbi:MAG: hypothetical protein KGK07_01540 [Chloroflexota bacterium]|nr:hypothetical protein [Chloroflexota bacterium]
MTTIVERAGVGCVIAEVMVVAVCRRKNVVILCALLVAFTGCSGGRRMQPTAQSSPSPGAARVANPQFAALPGARAIFGEHAGWAYQIELPVRWNGTLVMYIHGSHAGEPELSVEPPPIRSYLIRQGYAWAASSFDHNGVIPTLIPGIAADQTAALWDLFSQDIGRPRRTYVIGASMGGGAAVISAERYSDRYDGALALCPIAGVAPTYDSDSNYLVAAAYAAGVTQGEFDRTSLHTLLDTKIPSALSDPSTRARFEAIWVAMTGGNRPFATQGLHLREAALGGLSELEVQAGLIDNTHRMYALHGAAGISDDAFNKRAIRISPGPNRRAIPQSEEISGDIRVPVITLSATGDGLVPISEAQFIRRKVEARGKGQLLVQRSVQSPEHCGFVESELETSFEALVSWVERGIKPAGEDLLATDLTGIGARFTDVARLGSPAAAALPGARDRRDLNAHVTLDGKPFESGLLVAVVVRDGLVTQCNYENTLPAPDGQLHWTLAGDSEITGCGVPGADVQLMTYIGNAFMLSPQHAQWPSSAETMQLNVAFKSGSPAERLTLFHGQVVNASGARPAPRGVIDAFIGNTRCGRTSVPPTGFLAEEFRLYVVGPESVAGCTAGGTVRFRVDGKFVAQSRVNDFSVTNPDDRVDLVVP